MDTWQALLEESLPLIKEAAFRLCRKYRLSKEDSEDFFSILTIKLLEDDGRIVREWSGRSNFMTYMQTVIARELADYVRHRWGRWRPSAEAERLGAVAILLEQLLYRDGLSLDEAIRTLLINHHVEPTEAELREVAEKLPAKERRRFESTSTLSDHPSHDRSPEEIAIDWVDPADRKRVLDSLRRAIATLPKIEQVTIRLTVLRNCKVSRLAPRLGMDTPALYRLRTRALTKIRRCMEEDGISIELIRRILKNGGEDEA